MKRPRVLTAAFCKNICQSGRYGDGRGGHGLSLLVKPSSTGRTAKSWSQRIRLAGSATNLGLGSFPAVTLSNARGKALANARAVAEGRDPRGSGIPTFREAAEQVIQLQREGWRGDKTERLWRSRLAKYAFPAFGDRRIDQVEVRDVLAVIGPIWQSHAETAGKLKQILSVILRWSIAHGFRVDDPAAAVSSILPKQNGSRQHYKAVPHAQVGDVLSKIAVGGRYPYRSACFGLHDPYGLPVWRGTRGSVERAKP